MKKYESEGLLKSVICNCCGKELVVKDGIIREGVVSWNPKWDYFSERDGESHQMDICEACYNRWINRFRVKVEIQEETELL